VAWELGKRLSSNAIVSCDSGTITTWWARQIPVRRGQMHSLSGTLASMAAGLPYALAAQIAYPERQCVAFVGDGGFSMLMGEFATAVKYQLPIKVVVLKNNTLGQIKWEQMVFLGNPEYGCELQPINFAAFARACGGHGFKIDDPATCGEILDEAFELLGRDIVLAHAKELGGDGHAGGLALGTGVLDWDHYFALLNESSYKGPIIMHGFEERDLGASVDFLRQLLRTTGCA